MDFVKILQSIEELLYEVMSWLLLYPRSVFRTARNPLAVAIYVLRQVRQKEEDRFTEMVSPPLMLILSVLVAHIVELALDVPMHGAESGKLIQNLFGDSRATVATRCTLYAVHALVPACVVLRLKRRRLDKITLRGPFYVQCMLASVFALYFSTASALLRSEDEMVVIGEVASLVSVAWYLWAQIIVMRRMGGLHGFRATVYTLVTFVATFYVVWFGLFEFLEMSSQ